MACLCKWEENRLVNHGDSFETVIDAIDSRLEEIENLRDQQEENRNNIPLQLQGGPVAELLMERWEHLDDLWTTLDAFKSDVERAKDDDGSLVSDDLINELNDIYYSM